MPSTITVLGGGLAAVCGVVLLGFAYQVYSTREQPAATPFAMLLGVVGSSALALGAATTTKTAYMLLWLYAYLAIPVALAHFSFDYYGLSYLVSRRRIAAFLAPAVAATIGGTVLVLGTSAKSTGPTAPVEQLAWLPTVVFGVAQVLNRLGIYYAGGVILVAVGLVLQTVYRYEHLDAGLGLTLSFVGVWPWVAYLVAPQFVATTSFGVGIAVIAVFHVASLGAAALAYGPYQLFESTPAAGNVGPETVLDGMDDAVLVVDHDDHVLRLNAAARRTFGVTERDVIGGPLSAVIGSGLDALYGTDANELETVDGTRYFDATISQITDRRDYKQGSAIVLRDVTQRRTREQRLQVLNRVLRHNLRNDMNVIRGRAELVADSGAGDPEEHANRILSTSDDLLDLGERAREIEEMMAVPRRRHARADLDAVLSDVVNDLRKQYPAVEIRAKTSTEATVRADTRVLQPVLRNVIENACKHNDADEPTVSASIERYEDGSIEVMVTDDGPGIPEQERAVLAREDENPLEHGSGLGLWVAYWGVTRMGGSLTFSENYPRGTVVRIDLPAAADGTVETPTSSTETATLATETSTSV